MSRPHPKLTEKQRILDDLDLARKALSGSLRSVSTNFAPKALLSRSMTNHRIWWVAGAAVVGLLTTRMVVRMVAPTRSNATPPRTHQILQKSGWLTLLATPFIGLLRKSLIDFVTAEVRNRFAATSPPPSPNPLVSQQHV